MTATDATEHPVLTSVRALLERVVQAHRGPLTSQERRRLIDDAQQALGDLDRLALPAPAPAPAPAAEPPAPPAETAHPRPPPVTPETGLAAVAAAQVRLDDDRERLQRAVDGARAEGASWREIGAVLGVTAQSAHKRFDPEARRRHADYMRERSRRTSAVG